MEKQGKIIGTGKQDTLQCSGFRFFLILKFVYVHAHNVCNVCKYMCIQYVHALMYMSVGMSASCLVAGGQRTALGICPLLQLCLTQCLSFCSLLLYMPHLQAGESPPPILP